MSSGAEKAYGLLKSVLLMNERFDSLDGKIGDLSQDLSALAHSHADLGQRVAQIEGYMRGRADQAAAQASVPRIEG